VPRGKSPGEINPMSATKGGGFAAKIGEQQIKPVQKTRMLVVINFIYLIFWMIDMSQFLPYF